jgi:hypothetical protein
MRISQMVHELTTSALYWQPTKIISTSSHHSCLSWKVLSYQAQFQNKHESSGMFIIPRNFRQWSKALISMLFDYRRVRVITSSYKKCPNRKCKRSIARNSYKVNVKTISQHSPCTASTMALRQRTLHSTTKKIIDASRDTHDLCCISKPGFWCIWECNHNGGETI